MTDQDPYRLDKKHVRLAFDRAASSYDAAAVLQKEVATRLIGRLDFIKHQPRSILDLGSGTGYCASLLAKRFHKARIVSLDLAPSMLKLAKKRKGWFSSQRFACGDAEAMPFAEHSFDLVVSSLAIQWCQNLDAVFSEQQRVLRPDGLLLRKN